MTFKNYIDESFSLKDYDIKKAEADVNRNKKLIKLIRELELLSAEYYKNDQGLVSKTIDKSVDLLKPVTTNKMFKLTADELIKTEPDLYIK